MQLQWFTTENIFFVLSKSLLNICKQFVIYKILECIVLHTSTVNLNPFLTVFFLV